MKANLAIFWGSLVFNQGIISPVPEISQDFTMETEGDEGLLRCSLANKVCLPFSASFEKGHPLAGAFVPKSLPVYSVSVFHSFRCQPISLIPLESNFVSQVVPFSNFPGDEFSRLVSVPISEGVASPLETSNQNVKDCSFLREPLSSPEELCVSGRVSSPEPKPPTLLLEGFQIEGLMPRKMVKVQSVLKSLRIGIVKDNGKGAAVESRSTLLADKVYFRRKRKTVCGIQGEA